MTLCYGMTTVTYRGVVGSIGWIDVSGVLTARDANAARVAVTEWAAENGALAVIVDARNLCLLVEPELLGHLPADVPGPVVVVVDAGQIQAWRQWARMRAGLGLVRGIFTEVEAALSWVRKELRAARSMETVPAPLAPARPTRAALRPAA